MALIRWEPFREVDALQKEMNRLFDTLAPGQFGNGEKLGVSFVPAAEMTETADAIHLKLEVPGMEAKDLNIEATADSISISAIANLKLRLKKVVSLVQSSVMEVSAASFP